MVELDFIETMMTVLVQARQAQNLLHRVADLEAQRDQWKNKALGFKQALDISNGRLDFLLVNNVDGGEDNYFTFPDGQLFMTGDRLKEAIEKRKLDKQQNV